MPHEHGWPQYGQISAWLLPQSRNGEGTPLMTIAQEAYRGDEALAGLLRKSGYPADLGQIRRLLAGVVAAPEGEHPEDWIGLVAPEADPACRRQLQALRQEVAGSRKTASLPA